MMIRHIPRLIRACYRTLTTVELRSPPGMGKTTLIQQMAKQLAKLYEEPFGLITEHLSTMEGIDLRGIPERKRDEERGITITGWSQPPIFPSIDKFPLKDWPDGIPKRGILFLDEYLQGTNDVRKPAARLLLEGQIGEYALSEYGHWLVIAASNNQNDKSGSGKDLAMEQNRKMLIQLEPDLDAWIEWAEPNDVHFGTISFVKSNPAHIFAGVPKVDGPFASPRTIVMADKLLRDMAPEGEDFQLDVVGLEAAAGLIGEATAAAYATHLRKLGEIPDFDDIVANPGGTKIPKGIDNLYLTSQMLAFRVDKDTAVPVLKYLQRLPEELQIPALRFALRRTPAIGRQPEFIKWCQKNQDLVVKIAGSSIYK